MGIKFDLFKKKQPQSQNIDNSVIVNPNTDIPSNVDKLFEKENTTSQNQQNRQDTTYQQDQQNIVVVDNNNTKKKFNLSCLFKKKPKTPKQKQDDKQDGVIKDVKPKKKFNFKELFKKKQKEEQTTQNTTEEKPQYTVYSFNYQDGEVTTTNNSEIPKQIPKEFSWLKKVVPKTLEKAEEDGTEMPVLFYYKKYAVVIQTNLFSQGAYFVYVLDKKYIQYFKEDKNIEPNEIKKANASDNKTLIQAGALGVILITIAGIGGYMLFGNKSKPKPIIVPKPIQPVKPVAQAQKPAPKPPPDPRVLSISLIDNLITKLESYKPTAIVRSVSINGTNANIQTDWLTFQPNAKGVYNQRLKHIVFKESGSVQGTPIDIKPTMRTPQCLEGLAKLHAIFTNYQSGKISFYVNIPINNKNMQDIKPLAIAYLKLFSNVDQACGYNLNLKSLSMSASGITGVFELWL